jgi:uncharacterized membrane protein
VPDLSCAPAVGAKAALSKRLKTVSNALVFMFIIVFLAWFDLIRRLDQFITGLDRFVASAFFTFG